MPQSTPPAYASASGFAVSRPAPAARNRASMARLAVLALALSAKAGEVDDDALRRAVIAVVEVFGTDDPLSGEVRAMARDWPRLRADRAALMIAGAELERAITRSTWPAPSGRADLDG